MFAERIERRSGVARQPVGTMSVLSFIAPAYGIAGRLRSPASPEMRVRRREIRAAFPEVQVCDA